MLDAYTPLKAVSSASSNYAAPGDTEPPPTKILAADDMGACLWIMKKTAEAVVLLADGFEEIEAITIIDTLRRAQIETVTAAIGNGLQVHGGHGITVTADCLLSDLTGDSQRLVVAQV